MKRICIAYRGVFNFKKMQKGEIDNQLLREIEFNLNNHKTMIFDTFEDSDIDFYFSTYNLNESVNQIYKQNLNLKYYGYIPTMMSANATWVAQLMHYKNLIFQIKKQNILYDYIIFTRPDLKMLESFDNLNINFSAFNIVLEHLSGNCDDNLFIFSQKFLDVFEECIDNLTRENNITHAINHELVKKSVPINYLVEYKPYPNPDGTDMGQKVFSLCR